MEPKRRVLTDDEQFVLNEVQAHWQKQNTVDEVFFTDQDEAALFVRARDGSWRVMVVLTNLGVWHRDGTLSDPGASEANQGARRGLRDRDET